MPSLWNIPGVAKMSWQIDAVLRLITSKEGWAFLIQFVIIAVACYSLITQTNLTFRMDQPFTYTIPISQWAGWALVANAIGGLIIARTILPGLKSPLIECPKCKKPGAYVKSATYYCNDCGEITPIGEQNWKGA